MSVARHRYYNLSAVDPTGYCLECGVKLQGRRRKYCSDEHAEAYFARYDYNGMIAQVLKRDNWTCQICGSRYPHETIPPLAEHRRWIEVDHIVPVSEGGDPLDMANCRTLCSKCHKKETAEWHRLRALKRRYGSAVREAPQAEAKRKEDSGQLILF